MDNKKLFEALYLGRKANFSKALFHREILAFWEDLKDFACNERPIVKAEGINLKFVQKQLKNKGHILIPKRKKNE